ncbi:MAG: apolipoprotein N-acyltransferase [Acidobacteriota bacterium]
MRPGTGAGLAALSGLLLALAYPPADLFPLGWVALAPLLAAVRRARPGPALARGLLCGAVFFSTLLHWLARVMVTYGGLSWTLATAILALLVLYLSGFFAAFGALAAAGCRRFGPWGLLLCPIAWVGLELARARLLGGFPWGLLGYSQVRNLPLLQVASIGGIYAVSLLVMVANAGLAVIVLPRRGAATRVRAAGAWLLVLFGAAEAGGLAVLAGDGGPAVGGAPRRRGIVPATVAQEKTGAAAAAAALSSDLLRMTREAAESGARIVVWPESSSPVSFRRPVRVREEGGYGVRVERGGAFVDRVAELVRDLDIELIAGSVDYRVEGERLRAFNSAFRIAPDGSLGPVYDKIHLVPFGEYVPLERALFFVNRLVEGAVAAFASGRDPRPLPTRSGPAATVICYEAIFPELVRRVARDAAFIVNITNDAWFGRSAGPHQHLAMAVVRAVETRRYLVRAANTGISAIVDPFGRILERSDLERRAVLVGAIHAGGGRPLYARTGDLLAWACVILTLALTAAPSAAFSRSGGRPGGERPGHVREERRSRSR